MTTIVIVFHTVSIMDSEKLLVFLLCLLCKADATLIITAGNLVRLFLCGDAYCLKKTT